LSSMDAEVAGRQLSSPQIATMKINSDFIARRLYSKEILGRLPNSGTVA
jgi:hypothetical protein